MTQESLKYYSNFSSRTDLNKYSHNALLLYSLQLKYGIDDIDEVAANSLLDSSHDKKTDLLYIDTERGEAVIAQGFYSIKDRKEAPANKASDLNTAVTWLLTRNIEDLPEKLQSAAHELRQKINENEIKRITLWYSHNLLESVNVQEELKTAENTLQSILRNNYPDKIIESHSLEVGLKTIEDWYLGLTIPIMITEKIQINNCFGFISSGDTWQSFSTSIPAELIYNLYKQYNTKLFSANVRDYLGSRGSDSNINNSIKKTANDEPNNFFVFNNGITALVNNFVYNEESKTLEIEGLSIVNGAQTTGAIGSLTVSPKEGMRIPMRLIKCSDVNTVSSIVKYNNSQNKINAPDFRSNDSIQKRLSIEFSELGKLTYSARRGGAADVIKRNPFVLPSITAGQVLAAFHGEPSIAYNDKSKIWDSDRLYSMFFNEQTTAAHIFLCYSLVKTIEKLKFELLRKDENNLLETEKKAIKFLRSRGSIILFASSIADCLEIILSRKISNKFSIKFCRNFSLEEAENEWRKVVDIAISFVDNLDSGLQDGIKNKEKTESARKTFVQLMGAVRIANSVILDNFSKSIC